VVFPGMVRRNDRRGSEQIRRLMKSTLTLFEHEPEGFPWTDRDLAALNRMQSAMGIEILRASVRGKERILRATQYVGVVRLGNHTIQVLPKIYQSLDASVRGQQAEATRNLLHMLAYAGELQIREHELAALIRRELDWFEILTHLFAQHLLEEWQRGAHRGYQIVEDELPILKGKWRIADQLRRPERKHIFCVAYDEFTADNRLNRVFRYVVERLFCLTRDANNQQLLGELRQWMEEVTLLPSVAVHDASPAEITRLSQRYEPLLNLARLFLDGGALQMQAGDVSTFAFMLDMNQLFEMFLANFIRRHRVEILPATLKGCDLLLQSRGARRFLAKRDDEKQVFLLKPDLAFRNPKVNGDQQFPLLLDTKYKFLDTNNRRHGIAPDDFYQMYAYAHRYKCQRVLLVYPQTAEISDPLRVRFNVLESDKIVIAVTVDLRVRLDQAEGEGSLKNELRDVLTQIFKQEEPHGEARN
jgi:5-methylcytosine-specific restriction enzyme subunit McrC